MKMVVVEPDMPGSMDDHDRPFRRAVKGQRWPGLWAHVRPPTTMRGILLWRDGRTMVVDNWDNYDLYSSADDQVAGGYEVVFDTEDWQYQVMVAAGFTFEPCEAAPPPVQPGVYPTLYQPTY
jgi:hypothetical protein